MKKIMTNMVLISLLILSMTLIAVPITRCVDEDPVHIYYDGSKISGSPGPIVYSGPCTTPYFDFTVKVQWDTLPNPAQVNWADVSMVEKSSFGITFDPLSTTLYNPSPNWIWVIVHVPTAGLPAGTYYANIYADTTAQGPNKTPKVAGTDGFFRFVKTPCVPTTANVVFGQIGVGNDFTGTVLAIDGTTNLGVGDLPKTYTWNIGDSHTFEYASPLVVTVNGKQYVWTSTSGLSTAQSGTIIVPSAGGSVTGYYKTQYYLTVTSPYDTPGGMGWYDDGTTAYATLATGTVDIIPGWVKAVFIGWSGDASGTGLTSDAILMDGAKTAVADWKIQYYLSVVTDPSNLPTIPGADWYDHCTYVDLTAPGIVPVSTGVQYRFDYWDVDGTPVSGNPITIHMNTYHTATAHYIVQYYLTLATDPAGVSTPSGEGWYDGGTCAPISTDEYVDIVLGSSRYRFNGWTTVDMQEIADPSLTSTTVLMDKAKTVTANYVTQYYLTVKTDPEGLVTILGEGWYDKCTYVELTAPSVTGYVFVYWDVDAINVEGNLITVHMDTWHTATAHYWLELEYEQFVTDSSFNVITKFDTVWTPKDLRKTTYKLASTNPGQFMLNIKIHNTWPVAISPTISFTIDPDFILKGADPIQVHDGYGKTGNRIPATVTYNPETGIGTVTMGNIDPCVTLYLTVHMEYEPARGYFDKTEMQTWKSMLGHGMDTFLCGYNVEVPGPFPFDVADTSSTTITDPIVVLGSED